VPPNEPIIAMKLERLGLVPSYTKPAMARAATKALGVTGTEYPVKPASGAVPASTSLGRYLSARVVSGRGAGACSTNAPVLLVEFGTGPWPEGDSPGHGVDGPVRGQIPPPAPDDNATYWPGDFSPMHYQQLLFGDSYPSYDALGFVQTAADPAAAKPAGRSGLPFTTQLRDTSDDTMRDHYLEQSQGT
jgi:hypothetical protein